MLFLSLLLTGCGSSVNVAVDGAVHLHDLSPLPTPQSTDVVPIRVAVAAVISPKGTVESYSPLFSYLSEATGRPVEIVQRRTYAEVNDLVRTGEVDLAFVCTSSYLVGRRDFGMQLLVAPQVQGRTTYQAYLIVPADSPAQSLEDLRGGVFAFTDPISFSGRMVPTYWLQQMGEVPETFFKRTFFTYSHDDAIHAVVRHLADGASIDSLVFDFAVQRDPSLLEQVRIIRKSEPYGIPPVVVGPSVRPQIRSLLQEILLGMADDPQGQAALQALGYDRFVMVDEALYQSAMQVQDALHFELQETP
ncbi:MAG: phosphate/phosphite/phosphonate ABC transporter substrate-binding protein [Anaerolineae bacterium]|nr:MAG: phosphate/phosphite/phosphonate ABC transporter substrate-binding protein [Anaerolineae bacterium]